MTFRSKIKSTTASMCALTLCLSTVAPVSATTRGGSAKQSLAVVRGTSGFAPSLSEAELLPIFTAIEEIPDEVLAAGNTSTHRWLEDKLQGDSRPPEMTTYGVAGCVSAIGIALVTSLPAFKVARIRKALKQAGGATTFVKTFKRVYDEQRSRGVDFANAVQEGVNAGAHMAAPEAKQALLDLFNLGNLYSACFE
ncbi:hypothetical protein [Corynebacterium glucuronolyticum]|uniref:hypothetical protein n=1 Tax=Corynebacterium glucuronolyticum TaxID=39791 RepID=UPI001E388511|nr:hypothetical protein [Corynebacterium glucuronolyticum]